MANLRNFAWEKAYSGMEAGFWYSGFYVGKGVMETITEEVFSITGTASVLFTNIEIKKAVVAMAPGDKKPEGKCKVSLDITIKPPVGDQIKINKDLSDVPYKTENDHLVLTIEDKTLPFSELRLKGKDRKYSWLAVRLRVTGGLVWVGAWPLKEAMVKEDMEVEFFK